MLSLPKSTQKVCPMNLSDRITIDPAICQGKPTIRGLPYPVETMMELFSAGMSIDEILDDYKNLEREDLLAVLAYTTCFLQYECTETDAETRFRLRAAQGNAAEGLAILDKLDKHYAQ